MTGTAVEIVDNPEASRYEAVLDGETVGFCSYRDAEGVVLLPHAEVSSSVEGRGIGSALARGTLDDLRAKGRSIVPLCPFIVDFIRKNPEYENMVAP
ncbi:MAG TPA: GNAT family N-acetyltransferase [Jatrophihabitantaceae bacterium]|jgi:predicted GNAT family acetyltransferase|nr:GNAT family N-acetyltransferase [Jatrophihabitantaceae bacterium]